MGSHAQLSSAAAGFQETSVSSALSHTSSDRVAGVSRLPRSGLESLRGAAPVVPLTRHASVRQGVSFLVDDSDTGMSKSMRGALIGAGLGGLAGVGVTLATSMNNEFWPVVMLQNLGSGALIGALVGAIIARL